MSRQLPAFAISLVIHCIVFAILFTIRFAPQVLDPQLAIESIFSEEPTMEDLTQDLQEATEIAETMNVVAGSTALSNAMGGTGAPAVAQKQLDQAESLKVPDFTVNAGTIDVAGIGELGTDLGEGEVTGEIGAVVEGYGAALGRITQEILRHMRESRVIVVWLFDESDSMKDDQEDIKQQFHKVYEELGIAQQQDEKIRGTKDILETVILSYGAKVNQHTKKPTSDVQEVRKAIDQIVVDESGIENTCSALAQALDVYGPMARKSRRKLVIVLVTDESGSDGAGVDVVVEKAKRAASPIYIMGRESVFGYPYARIRWTSPENLTYWLQIDRGPESAYPEALQFDGLHARWDAHSSGFGPYEQSRLALETGGIFFVLPSEEENLVGQEALEKRKFQFFDMKEYVPSLDSRREYEQERNASRFRKLQWDIIVRLNPHLDPELNVREHHYSTDVAEFQEEGKQNFTKALKAMVLLDAAAQELQKAKPLRATEESTRWRANYDLMLAQTMAYRVRLFQYLLALDQHSKNFGPPKNPKNNEWNLIRTSQMLEPDAQVVKATKIDTEVLKEQEQLAREQFAYVIKTHPRTPWSNRAEYELRQGFGLRFAEGYRDPRYKTTKVVLPKQ